MEGFFTITDLETVFRFRDRFPRTAPERIPLLSAARRVLAETITVSDDYPDFSRATMDGFAVKSAETFGASEANPVYLRLSGEIIMGGTPPGAVRKGEAMAIATGGMLPKGADSVVMREYVTEIDAETLEIVKSVAPGHNIIASGEDMPAGSTLLRQGSELRPADCGALAALGHTELPVYKRPVIGIVSTGDEIIPVDQKPQPGQIRDVNTYSLASMIKDRNWDARTYGIVEDDAESLRAVCRKALEEVDMLLVSGGSSVGARDMTIEAVKGLFDAEILVHGIAISPGKPTILARSGNIPIWGLPGQVTSAMIVFDRVVRPFIETAAGRSTAPGERDIRLSAILSRNLSSTQGRVDYIRTRLLPAREGWLAEPVLGKSGLIKTMLQADGLIEIDKNSEGLLKNSPVSVILLS
jgi:molybdopterin molybdotransferase